MQYFRPIDVILIRKRIRDFAPADTTYLNPKASFVAPDGPYVDGEWFRLDSNYKVVRAYTAGAAAYEETAPCWPLFAEQGRYDTQRTGMIPLIWEQQYEVKVYSHVYEGDGTWATAGMPFTVGTITDPDGVERAGIKEIDLPPVAGTSGLICGYITEAPSAAHETMKVLVTPFAPPTAIA
jgi:hypothetical protein